jgi:hypothetical protein
MGRQRSTTRPNTVSNIYVVKEEENMRFSRWLVKNYKNSDTPIGDLARDVANDRDAPRHRSGKRGWETYLSFRHACRGCLEALDDAFELYKADQHERT